MEKHRVTIPLATGESVSGVLTVPPQRSAGPTTGIITAHGAGNDMENPLLVAFTDGVAKARYPALRFNFPYREQGRKAPDRQEKLYDTWAAACRYFREDVGLGVSRIIAAGKSMGGRVASQMVAEKILLVEGLIFLGYPLHSMADRSKLRDTHLYTIEIPMLFFAGTRDRLCDLEKLHTTLKKLKAPWELATIEGGDHSFHVPKAMGITESAIFDRVVNTTIRWLERTVSTG